MNGNWMKWLQELAKFCGAVVLIGTLAYFLFGIRFVSKDEYQKHLDWSAEKSAQIDINTVQITQTNVMILDNLRKLNENIDRLNDRMARVETKLEGARRY